MTDSARRGALSLLLRHEAEGGYANLLPSEGRLAEMPERERALLIALFYGTIERRLTLDYAIGVLSGRGAQSLTPHTRAALELGLYQLYFTDIPPHAAVSETVKLGKSAGERGLLNAVLRAGARGMPKPPPRERDLARHLSILHSIPAPTVRYFLSRLGEEETPSLLTAFNTRPPLFLRVNTLRTSREDFLTLLRTAALSAEADPLTRYGIRIQDAPPVSAIPGYREGLFFVQDASSQLAGELLAPRPGDTVLDLCACPGGKSFGAALLADDRATVISRDIHASKLSLIREGAARLGLSSITVEEWDATLPDPALFGRCQRVICDVPCSGLGVIAKKPDLRYRGVSSLSELTALSSRILDAAADALAVGGRMVFSTCTLTREENEEAVRALLARRSDLYTEPFTLDTRTAEEGMLTLWPHKDGTDGFFIANIRRR